jgi:hypothetical protein
MPSTLPLKTVVHNGGLLSFEIAREWSHEVKDDGTQVFWHPPSGSGTLRASSITATKPSEAVSLPAVEALNATSPVFVRDDGIAWTHYRIEKKNGGEATVMYWWKLAQSVAPKYFRVAYFSFTIYANEEQCPATARQISLLSDTLPKTMFGPLQSYER